MHGIKVDSEWREKYFQMKCGDIINWRIVGVISYLYQTNEILSIVLMEFCLNNFSLEFLRNRLCDSTRHFLISLIFNFFSAFFYWFDFLSTFLINLIFTTQTLCAVYSSLNTRKGMGKILQIIQQIFDVDLWKETLSISHLCSYLRLVPVQIRVLLTGFFLGAVLQSDFNISLVLKLFVDLEGLYIDYRTVIIETDAF